MLWLRLLFQQILLRMYSSRRSVSGEIFLGLILRFRLLPWFVS